MPEISREILNRIYAAVDYLANIETQDRSLIIDMSQAMINDVIETGELLPMIDYIKRFCDVIDGPDDVQRIADDI
jgi:transcription initiation factor TFIIIB Brf1 subunit/transcription initiation factor TFIIB